MKKLQVQYDQVTTKIQNIKVKAQDAQTKIQQIVQQALKDLYEVVEDKTSILKADRLEIARQYKEC